MVDFTLDNRVISMLEVFLQHMEFLFSVYNQNMRIVADCDRVLRCLRFFRCDENRMDIPWDIPFIYPQQWTIRIIYNQFIVRQNWQTTK